MSGNNRPAIVLQPRDRHLLEELGTLRIVDREQAKLVCGFQSTTRANARLLALTKSGLLRRFFIGTSAGGLKATYSLSPKGAAVAQVPHSAPQRKNNAALVGDLFIEHQLALNSLILELQYRPIPIHGIALCRWRYFSQPISQKFPLIPDAYIELNSPSGIKAMFLEVDLGTESARVWTRKVQLYLRFALSGEFQRAFHQPQFRVLVVAPSERRLRSIRAIVAKQTEKIFWLRSFQTLNRGFWSPLWWRPTGGQTHALL